LIKGYLLIHPDVDAPKVDSFVNKNVKVISHDGDLALWFSKILHGVERRGQLIDKHNSVKSSFPFLSKRHNPLEYSRNDDRISSALQEVLRNASEQ